jgi:hypothetical protein
MGQCESEGYEVSGVHALTLLAALRERCNGDVDKYDDLAEGTHAPTAATDDYIYGYNKGLSEAFRAMVGRIAEIEKMLEAVKHVAD